MANIKDVAKLAGCGIATVSRVINKSGYVKKETREKVEAVIKELGYQPNEIARSMTRQKNNLVAFILPNSMHLFFAELLYYVEEELFDLGYKLMLCNSSEQLEKEIQYLDMLKNNRVDAVILLTNNDVEKYLNKSLPIVSFDRYFDGVPYGFPVAVEGWGMGYNADILEDAGVNPDNLTTLAAYETAFAAIQTYFDDNSMDDYAVVSMAAASGMTWVTGLHNFNGYLSGGLAYDDSSVIDDLNEGTVNTARLTAYADWVE